MKTTSILDVDGRLTPASTFLVVHHAFRRDLARFPAAVRKIGENPEDTARIDAFSGHWAHFRAALEVHHEQEDTQLFPMLLATAPGLGDLIGALKGKHHDLDHALDRVGGLVAQLPEPEAAEEASAAFDDFAAFLSFHLDTEEAHLVPVMLSAGSGIDGSVAESGGPGPSPAGDHGAGLGLGEVPVSFALPWCADGLDEAVTSKLLEDLPESQREGFPAWSQAYEDSLALWA